MTINEQCSLAEYNTLIIFGEHIFVNPVANDIENMELDL